MSQGWISLIVLHLDPPPAASTRIYILGERPFNYRNLQLVPQARAEDVLAVVELTGRFLIL
jgi:hypothetical protein